MKRFYWNGGSNILFLIIIALVIVQRLVEVLIAKNNEKRMLIQGAYEVGASHYPYMLAMHISFFISLIAEVVILEQGYSPLFLLLLAIFLVVQCLRV